ncbi:cullin-associated NEDD8-dissociated protein-like protein [Tothia fuscella]|uniref:Cullin-associated NEDD8-dissociated protein-like protein n=1 Tax=Tothia fuscella TaxID=1048955 RepID=A0A9P4NX82_9PEZI|nr:cullin-associated NEDD8-dissociated protein-like protein [Tothia fuscella]
MATAAAPSQPTSNAVAALLPKLYEDDPDLRYMGLADLSHLLSIAPPGMLAHDWNVSAKTVDGLLTVLKDSNGEVQNMAIKCLGPFVNKVADNVLCPLIDKISTVEIGDAVDNSVPALALRAIVVSLPRPTPGAPRSKPALDAYSAVSRALIPRLVGYWVFPPSRNDLPKPPTGMLTIDIENNTDSNAIDVLTEVGRCYGTMLQEAEVNALAKISLEILQHDRTSSVLKKKAVVAIAVLAPHFSNKALEQFILRIVEFLRSPGLTNNKRKLYITLLGSIAKSIPKKMGPTLKKIAPHVLAALSQAEIDRDLAQLEETEERDPEADEVREAALITLESFLLACPEDMKYFTKDTIDIINRFLKYDPNLAEDIDDEEMEEDDEDAFDGEEDFEEEAGADDEDDSSWKVRRTAAKVAHVFIQTRSSGDLLEDGTLYKTVAPALVSRFKEREETVRLEVLSALSLLVRLTGGRKAANNNHLTETITHSAMGPPHSRKRRRGGSDASMFDSHTQIALSVAPQPTTPPPGSAMSSLENLSPDIVRGVALLLKSQPLPTKQASISLMKNLAISLQGRLTDYLSQTIDPVVEAVKSTNLGSSSGGSHVTTVNSFRMEALQYLSAVADAHSSQALQPYLGKIIPALVSATKAKYTKVSVEALNAVEAYIKALTPPKSTHASQSDSACLKQLYDAISDRITNSEADTEVRQLAIRALGLLLGRTSSTALLSPSDRAGGFSTLENRLKNELTQLPTIRAIETTVALTNDANEFPHGWVALVSLELGAQLRKSRRMVRGSSLAALKTLSMNAASRAHLNSQTIADLLPLLLPLLSADDLHMLGPTLLILSTFVQQDARAVMTPDFTNAFGHMLMHTIVGSTLEALVVLTRTIGESGVGGPLMETLLKDVSMKANPDLVGKVVGNLLVAGGSTVPVKLNDFVGELKGKRDEKRKCLALSVLGEAALRLSTSSPLQPKLFMEYFTAESDKIPLAAAVALGRAGAGNIQVYLPAILQAMGSPKSNQYLLLHSIREIVQHDGTEAQIIPFAGTLWQNLLSASQADDNRAIGAECIGRLAVIDPKTYLPQLQTFLTDRTPGVRGMVISALRYTFADTDETYDEYLKPVIIGMLQTMLNETDLENRRLALTTLNSATHNKSELILPHMGQLLPLAMKETVPRPELMREVQMGPFKHKVDDGLEIRKSAYETLYALLESAFTLLDIPTFYDRVIAGLTDDHDIRTLCTLMLLRLIHLAPGETASRLDVLVEPFKAVLNTKPKENAVKQEIERMHEESRDVVRVSLVLSKSFVEESNDGGRPWGLFWEGVRKDFGGLVKLGEEEAREKER